MDYNPTGVVEGGRQHFELVIAAPVTAAMIFISLLPPVFEYVKARREGARQEAVQTPHPLRLSKIDRQWVGKGRWLLGCGLIGLLTTPGGLWKGDGGWCCVLVCGRCSWILCVWFFPQQARADLGIKG